MSLGFNRIHFVLGVLVVAVLGALVTSGWVPDSGNTGLLPESVRANPASYRPVYVVYSGGSWGYGSGK